MKEYLRINKLAYDELAREYAYRRDNVGKYSEKTDFLGNSLLKYTKKKHPTVLEIGSGSGQILKFFEDNGCRTVGVDLSTSMCDLSKAESPRSIIINSDINEVNFIGNQFDLIYMGALIHLFPLDDEIIIMKKVWNWLAEDGYIFVNTTCHDYSCEGYYEKQDYLNRKKRFRRYWSENDFEAFITECGYSIIEKLYTDEKDKDKKWVAFIACRGKSNEKN